MSDTDGSSNTSSDERAPLIVQLHQERKRLAEEIKQRRRAEELARCVIDCNLDAIVVVDESGAVIDWNLPAERVFGWNREAIIGRNIADTIIPQRHRDEHRHGMRNFVKSGGGTMLDRRLELTALRRSGEEFPIELMIAPTRTTRPWLFSACIRDISERNRLEERFRATVESAPTAMVMIDSTGGIVLVNAETEKLFGYSRDELLGQPVEMLVPNRYRPRHSEQRRDFFSHPEARRMGEGRDLYGLRKDGREFPVEIGLNPIETDEGLFVLGAVVDITERKRFEERMCRLNEELECRVRERTAALAQANEALELSNVELKQFAYVASHDLQAPLRGIAGFAQFLQMDYQGKLDGTADEYIGQIVDGAQRMQRLISDLLAYSRVESRARAFTPTDLAAVFDDAVSLLRAEIEEIGGEVTRGDLPIVVGDAAQLSQLFQNLIGNAIKYHSGDQPRVHVTSRRTCGEHTIAVQDNGIGIDSKHHERIFEIFRRLHTQEQYPGTGIGLAVCRRIVLRHGGRIWVESNTMNGSTFYFTVPERAD